MPRAGGIQHLELFQGRACSICEGVKFQKPMPSRPRRKVPRQPFARDVLFHQVSELAFRLGPNLNVRPAQRGGSFAPGLDVPHRQVGFIGGVVESKGGHSRVVAKHGTHQARSGPLPSGGTCLAACFSAREPPAHPRPTMRQLLSRRCPGNPWNRQGFGVVQPLGKGRPVARRFSHLRSVGTKRPCR